MKIAHSATLICCFLRWNKPPCTLALSIIILVIKLEVGLNQQYYRAWSECMDVQADQALYWWQRIITYSSSSVRVTIYVGKEMLTILLVKIKPSVTEIISYLLPSLVYGKQKYFHMSDKIKVEMIFCMLSIDYRHYNLSTTVIIVLNY